MPLSKRVQPCALRAPSTQTPQMKPSGPLLGALAGIFRKLTALKAYCEPLIMGGGPFPGGGPFLGGGFLRPSLARIPAAIPPPMSVPPKPTAVAVSNAASASVAAPAPATQPAFPRPGRAVAIARAGETFQSTVSPSRPTAALTVSGL